MSKRVLTILLASVVLGLLMRELPNRGLMQVLAGVLPPSPVANAPGAGAQPGSAGPDALDSRSDTPTKSSVGKASRPRSLGEGLTESDPNRRSKFFAVAGQPTISGANQDESTAKKASTRVREGREVREMHATFASVGERMSCKLPGLQASVTVLENLALERVSETMMRHAEDATWEVEGVITEYQGRNYLLLQRAVVNSVTVDEQ
jgi:hypothetical protein